MVERPALCQGSRLAARYLQSQSRRHGHHAGGEQKIDVLFRKLEARLIDLVEEILDRHFEQPRNRKA